MAGEFNPASATETVETDASATAPAPKKQRAPRRQKAVAEATAPSAEIAKSTRAYRKRGSAPTEVKSVAAEAKVVARGKAKGGAKSTTAKPTKQTERAPATAVEEMADLIKLEEENKSLRKALADKLRAENSDLRKRLGLD